MTLSVYDMLCREVARLLDAELVGEGVSDVDWDASSMSSGVYCYVPSVADRQFRASRRMLLIR